MKIDIPKIEKIGVYAIRNMENNRYYVGSSVNIYTRLKTHARNNFKLVNMKMMEDAFQRGAKFEILILETFEDNTITEEQLRDRERYYIDYYDSIKNGYNNNYPWCNGVLEKGLLSCPLQKEHIAVNLPIGTKGRIKRLAGQSCNAFILPLVLAELEKLERLEQSDTSRAVTSSPSRPEPEDTDSIQIPF